MNKVQKKALGLALMGLAALIAIILVVTLLLLAIQYGQSSGDWSAVVVFGLVSMGASGYGGWYLYAENKNADIPE